MIGRSLLHYHRGLKRGNRSLNRCKRFSCFGKFGDVSDKGSLDGLILVVGPVKVLTGNGTFEFEGKINRLPFFT